MKNIFHLIIYFHYHTNQTHNGYQDNCSCIHHGRCNISPNTHFCPCLANQMS